MDQREFPLLQRVGAPSAAPYQWIRYAKTYRQAVRLAWKFRPEGLTREELAREVSKIIKPDRMYPQHITDYLHPDDKPSRRDLPADKLAAFEQVVGNSIVSQWLASQSRLTVLEQMQANALAEAA